MKSYGFKDGDKILKVDGKDFENVIGYQNTFMFLRGVNEVRLEHSNGKQEKSVFLKTYWFNVMIKMDAMDHLFLIAYTFGFK